MNMHFLVIDGPEKGRAILVQPGPDFMMGRGHDAYYRIHDEKTSRYHCELLLEDDYVKVTCNGGDGGTRVNGMKIQEYPLKLGDVLQIGETKLRLCEGDGKPKPPAAPPPNPLAVLVGTTLSHFQVGQIIGTGELSLVFIAKDMDKKQTVALRVLQPEFALDDQKMQRFVGGMKTAMSLQHPNLAATYGAGKAKVYCWMAMEYVDGETVAQAIDHIVETGTADWKFALRMAIHVTRALVYAHNKGIIHRNINPKNIHQDGPTQTFKLGDLLLAKALEEGCSDLSKLAGKSAAAVSYMSPERTREGATMDARSDLFSLGAVIYALLTGQPPCEGATVNAQINFIREITPDKPTDYNPSVPLLFEGIVVKLLQKKPERRFQSASELLGELEKIAKFSGVKV